MISVMTMCLPMTPSRLPDPFFPPTGSGIIQAGLMPGLFLFWSFFYKAFIL